MAVLAADASTLADLLSLPGDTVVTITGSGVSAGVSDAALAGFEGSVANPFLVLSTGLVSQVIGPNTDEDQGVDLGLEGMSGDSVTVTFTIPRPADARGFAFDFTFLSEEADEYLGSAFDDFLSIRIDGVEAALDASGNRITVNTTAFRSPDEPEGTIFDGQTSLLSVSAPLVGSASTMTVSITVADRGDGLYDSAAFVSNLRFVTPQVIYLQFDEGTIDFSSFLDPSGFQLPGSGLTIAEQDQIVAAQNAIYSDFLVQFTRTRPLTGEYSTIHVGGAVEDLPAYLEATGNLLGRAEKIDYGNRDRSDDAFVLSDEITQVAGGPDLALLSQVIAHEAGHILGLRHVQGSGELLRPIADPDNITIGGSSNLAEIDQATGEIVPVGGTQDSHAELALNLGTAGEVGVVVADSVGDRTLKLFSFDARGTNPLYHAIVAVANSEDEVLSYVEVGDVPANGLIEVLIPATNSDKVVLLAQSSPTGGFDIFATASVPATFDPDATTEERVLNAFGVGVEAIDDRPLSLVKVAPDGNVSTIGSVVAFALDAGADAATDGADVLIGGQRVADTLIGLGGNDTLSGLGGNDRLFGNDGDDLIAGGGGNDALSGGAGADAFLFGSDARGTDRILDFGKADFVVTTTRLVDKNNDGIVTFGRNGLLDIPFSSLVEMTSDTGAAIRALELDGAFTRGSTQYFVYSLVGSDGDPQLALLNL